MKFRATLIGIVLGAAAAVALAGEPQPSTANPAFAQLKSLAGEWQAKSSRSEHARVRYEIVANGTAVMETFEHAGLGPEGKMVTIYTPAGDGIALTHYCMTGNQPQMKAERFDPATGELKFAFVKADNLAGSGAGHMRSAEFKFVSADRFLSSWQFYQDGKLKQTEAFEYTRVR